MAQREMNGGAGARHSRTNTALFLSEHLELYATAREPTTAARRAP